jgi:hypothetical protein
MSTAANPQAEADGQTKVRLVFLRRRGSNFPYEGRHLIGGSSSPVARSRAVQKI